MPRHREKVSRGVVFIDDVADNVAGADALGMRTVHFTSPAALWASPDLAALLQ